MKYLFFISFSLLVACSTAQYEKDESFAKLPKNQEGLSIATFAGGCFWCTEAVFERVKGVKYVISGYSGGEIENPTYREVSSGKTTHAEAIQVYYDQEVVSYDILLDVFFLGAHDPTQVNRQGPDRGPQYRSVAFYRSLAEKKAIQSKIEELEEIEFTEPIATQVSSFSVFYPAEKYHQDYYPAHQNNPYVQNVSKPKIIKFEKKFRELLKADYL
ncbi:MAG: peptide-methionine (S)-S-oxide reductase MsrA [Flavobacteriales bacterium]|nr:peptide-methionine (S)-S-oxide reductase MsrA [Flavobacteriales bacterium]